MAYVHHNLRGFPAGIHLGSAAEQLGLRGGERWWLGTTAAGAGPRRLGRGTAEGTAGAASGTVGRGCRLRSSIAAGTEQTNIELL